jgi:hypothetical protein
MFKELEAKQKKKKKKESDASDTDFKENGMIHLHLRWIIH